MASLAAGATFATLAISNAPAAEAAGPDAPTGAVDAFFRKLSNGFLQQMASSSAVSQQLPTLAITPAGSVGLRNAFSDALSSGVLKDFGTQESLSQVAQYVNGQDNSEWDFTASSPDANTLVLGFKRVVDSKAGLDIRKEDGSFSLSSGDGIDVKGTLQGSFTFSYDGSMVSLKQPSMSISTVGDLPAGRVVPAGLGILGVQVVGAAGDDDYGLLSTVSTAWANPDNDAAGALAFDNPATTDAADGELSAAGAATGIVTATRTGALKGHLVAAPRAGGPVAGLPTVGGTVDLSSTASGATFDSPQITSTVDDAAKPFLTLTPRDLAAGLSQAASAVLGMQNAKDGDLPLMRGSIANAVDAVGAIKQFLAAEVPDADTNDQTPGQPSFSSLQDMLTKLDSAAFAKTGWTIDVLTGDDAAKYDSATKKASFTLKATRDGVSNLELNVLGAATSGTADYKADGLTNAVGASFPLGSELVGRKVTSGTSYGTVKSIDSPTSLTLTGDWEGGQPAEDSAFAVEAADPKTGAPQLADTLNALTGIGVANADVSTATITPKVELTLPMALDLSAPLTYKNAQGETVNDCDPSSGTAPCPLQVKDASGLGRIITSLPLTSDRILLRQSPRDVLVADAAIKSPVQIATTSGYLGLSIDGDLDLSQASGEHLQTIKLTKGTALAPIDIPVPAFVEATRLQATRTPTDPTTDDVFSQTLAGKVTGTLKVTVDDAESVFEKDVSSTTLKLSANVNDLKGGDTSKVTVTADQPARAKLLKALNFDTDNPDSLFGGLREAFEAAGSDLTTMSGGGLDEPLPLLGTSISQLVGAGAAGAEGVTYGETAKTSTAPAMTTLTDGDAEFTPAFIGRQIVVGSALATILGVSSDGKTLSFGPQLASKPNDGTAYLVENELLGAVHVLTATAPQTLQEALAIASDSLGGDSEITFGLVDQGDTSALKLNIEWARKYEVGQAVSLELPTGSDLVAAGGGGELSIAVDGTISLGLVIPLTTDAMTDPLNEVKVDKGGSSIDLNVKVEAANAHFNANVGPIGVEMGRATSGDGGSIKAGIGVSITSGTGATDPSIKDFFTGGFSPEVTDGGACGGDKVIVLCASFPTWVNKASAGTLKVETELDATKKSIKQALTTTVTVPDVLKNAIEGAPFKIGSLSEGLQQYLFYTEVALRTASDDGEMPVVGKDLQAGADFLGDTREKIGDFIDKQGDISLVGPLKEYLTTQLNASLPGLVDGGASKILVDFTCRRTLEPPAKPTVAATDADPAGKSKYWYEVVTEAKDTSKTPAAVVLSKASEPSDGAVNENTLSAASNNKVTWDAVAGATGYKVLRAVTADTATTAPAASEFKLLKAVGVTASATTESLTDDGSMTPTAAPTLPAKAPVLSALKCADDASLTDIEGVTLNLKLGQGNISVAKGCEGDQCLKAELPVDLGIPGLSLKTGEGGGVVGKVGWSLDIGIGMSRSKGFYIDTKKQNEFAVAASLGVKDVSGTDLQAQLAIIDVDVTKRSSTDEFIGMFGIDIKGGTVDPDELSLKELTTLKIKDIFVVGIQAKVNVDWHLEASATAALPGVSTNFLLTWSWGLTSAGTPASTPGKPGDTSNLVIAFNQVKLNTGQFFGKALKPYLQQIVDASKPLQPIIDTIFTPMPVISDLSKAAGGDEVTIATLAEKFNTLPGGAKIQPFLKAIKLVKQLLTVSCDAGEDTCGILIGSFQLKKGQATTTRVSAGSAGSMIDKTNNYSPEAKASENIAGADKTGQLAKPGTISKLKELTAGLSIPVMEDPTMLFELIAGGDIPLVEFDSGPLSLGFQFQKSFGPIYAPPPVMMVIGGGASVTLRIAAGFDTYGIRRAIETGDGAQVLDSLYFKTVDKNGAPIPVVQFTGYLEAGASVSIGILEVGVVGGIKLTVGFYWNDPNSDGKFRLFEFGQAVANNPICLFNVSGELSLYIKVFVEIGFSPFSVSFDFNLINIKLLDFNLKPDCEPKPPRLGGVTGKTLYVFAGKLGTEGVRGKGWASGDKDETWVIRQVPEYKDSDNETVKAAVEVKGLGLTESFDDDGGAIDTVVVDGRDYAGTLTVTFVGGSGTDKGATAKPFTKKTVVFTGAGDDVIRTGQGSSYVDSGAGNDTVTTLDRTDLSVDPSTSSKAVVAGGPGNDAITVGNGNDVVSGDGSLTPTVASPNVEFAKSNAASPHNVTLSSVVSDASAPSDADLFKATVDATKDGSDQIAAGLGKVKLAGNGGNDTVGTANDSPLADSVGIKAGTTGGSATTEALYRGLSSTVVGGAGSDVLKSGSAADELFTGTYATFGESGDGAGDDAAKDVNVVDSGTGSDTVYGSNAVDFVTVHSQVGQNAKIYGGAADDVLTGGQGSDEIYGGPGDDYVVAAPATVGEPKSSNDVLGQSRLVTVLPGAGPSSKLLVGGTGQDRIYGSDGPSEIYGDTTTDKCKAQADPVSAEPSEAGSSDKDKADLILGGAGIDTVNAGGGNDWAYTAGANDVVCGNAGDDHLYAGDADDLVHGGSGADQAYGEAGNDQVYGNTGNDAAYGGAGNDRVQGNQGADWVDGGSEDDVAIGGTSKKGIVDGADVVLGGTGKDLLVGDNATTDVLAGSPYPTDLDSSDTTVGGKDFLSAGDDDDKAFGGLDEDTIYAGNGADYVEGNPGKDSIWGEAGDDDVAGGSSLVGVPSTTGQPDAGDVISGGSGKDDILGDNGNPTTRTLLDVPSAGAQPAGTTSGEDAIEGGSEDDRIFGQSANDTVKGGSGADTIDGNSGADTINGNEGADLIAGGSQQGATPSVAGTGIDDRNRVVSGVTRGDLISGDAGADVVVGDNGVPGASGTQLFDVPSAGAEPTANSYGDDQISGGDDPDRVFGQSGDDTITGEGADDVVDGNSGADTINGNGGNDVLVGGSQQGTTPGTSGAGVDDRDRRASGSWKGDFVHGDDGNDVVLGDNGRVTGSGLTAGVEEYDVWYASATTEAPNASGTDDLFGENDEDRIFGQGGNDRISGGAGDDRIAGDSGADQIAGDGGADDITGGSGLAQKPANLDRVRDGGDTILGGGPGVDTTDLADVVLGDNGSITRPGGTDPNRGGVAVRKVLAYDVAVVGGATVPGTVAGNDQVTGHGGSDLVYGQGGQDVIAGNGGDDWLEGNADQDVIRGGDDDDDVIGGSSNDVKTVSGPTGQVGEPGKGGFPTNPNKMLDAADRLWGDAGNDAVVGDNAKIDRVLTGGLWTYDTYQGAKLLKRVVLGARVDEGAGSYGNDEGHGGDGQDEMYAQLGADWFEGNAGEDSILGDLGEVTTTVRTGQSSVIESQGFIRETINVPGTLKRTTTLYPVPTSVTAGGLGGNDTLAGGTGSDVIHGGAANDKVWGNRSFTVDPVSGWIVGQPVVESDPGAGKDDDVIFGDHGDDQVWGGWQHDRMYGGHGADKIDMVTELNGVVTGDKKVDFKGMDFMYGGWGPDAMQADWSMPSPSHGTDKMVDSTGAYNGYFVCEGAYGGNSIMRQLSPDMETFWQKVSADDGLATVTTTNSSNWWELAMVFNADRGKNSNPVYDLNPAHFICDSN